MTSRLRITALLIAVLCGCGATEPPQTAAVKPAAAPAKLQPQLLDEVPPKAKEKKAKPDKPAPAAEKPAAAEAQAEFEPPFPNRENLFLAPKRSSTHGKIAGSVEQTIELLGFANVERPKVILSINGEVFPISEGEQQAGIEVISIQPPAVVLQRDRERWQATLEN